MITSFLAFLRDTLETQAPLRHFTSKGAFLSFSYTLLRKFNLQQRRSDAPARGAGLTANCLYASPKNFVTGIELHGPNTTIKTTLAIQRTLIRTKLICWLNRTSLQSPKQANNNLTAETPTTPEQQLRGNPPAINGHQAPPIEASSC